MSKFNITPRVTVPDDMEIPLVRGDYHGVSGEYRIAFEVFLALSSADIGAMLSQNLIGRFHWIFLCLTVGGLVVSLIQSIRYANKAKARKKADSE